MADSQRLVIHGIVVPDRGTEQLDGMQALKEEQQIAAWKVYTQFGGWRFLMTQPDAAAHVLGKLLLHLGEDRILWGTDSIWYGTPQDQISAEAKVKILGLNAAEAYGIDVEATRCAIADDDVSKAKLAIHEGHPG